jgi:phosphatidylserine/phosphatidylglycerophosphate/cardiolipin synthase-like enzyme
MKNKNTIISTIFSIIFILIFSYYNLEEYRDFYLEKELIQKQEIELKNNLKKFSLDNLEKLEESKLYYTPNKNLINIITQKINKAEKRIYLETYIFTEKRIRESLKKAKNR